MATYKKQLKDKDGNTIYPDVGLNLDDVVYSDDPTQPVGNPEPWIETGDIVNGAVTKNKIDWSSMSEDNNNIRKIYTKTVKGTTDGNGFFSVDSSVTPSNAIIVGTRGRGNYNGFYFVYSDTGQSRFTLRRLNWDFTAFANKYSECDIAYIKVN